MTQVENITKKVLESFYKYGHDVHRISLGLIFVWFGLLKRYSLFLKGNK